MGVVGGACDPLVGGRQGTSPLVIKLGGPPREVYLFVRGRGPIGVGFGNTDCTSAAPNAWAKLVLRSAPEEVRIDIVDVDYVGERRGQTTPYVAVVSDDDVEPSLEPAPRDAVPADAALVRWEVEPIACAESIEMFHCMRARIVLSGAVKKVIPLKRPLVGQVGCFPDGTGAFCGGASGATTISLEPTKGGVVEVRSTSESDGYCPPPDDCATRQTLMTFTIPTGVRLVPDPAGVWPPQR